MSKTLDEVINDFVDRNFGKCNTNEKKEIREAAKEQIKREIYDEISTEIYKQVKEDALKNADEMIATKAQKRQIKGLRNLAIEGLIVAFFVGLLVNQVTDIITFLKGEVIPKNLWVTFTISFIIFAMCIFTFTVEFILTVIKPWKGKNEKN